MNEIDMLNKEFKFPRFLFEIGNGLNTTISL